MARSCFFWLLGVLQLLQLSAHTAPSQTARASSGQKFLALRNSRFLVLGIDEAADSDGPVGRILVRQHGTAKNQCTQEELDDAIAHGYRPDLEFESHALSNRFFELRAKSTQIELHLDKRVTSVEPQSRIGGKRQAPEGDRQEASISDRATDDSKAASDVHHDGIYLKSYDSLSVHETMIKDRTRTDWFFHEIEGNKELFDNAVVLDVGTGTGILALFAARAGARKVYAVECSEIAGTAQRLVEDNGYAETVSVIKGNIEQLDLPEKVDIIISEWMGFYLLHESMLMSIISARDRFLRPHGLMLPSAARLFAAPANLAHVWEERVQFWRESHLTYALNMSAASARAQQDLARSPLIDIVPADALLSPGQVLWELNMHNVTAAEAALQQAALQFEVPTARRLHGVCLWFDVDGLNQSSPPLSTSPAGPPTHWKQTSVLLGEEVDLQEGAEGRAGRQVGCEVTVMQESRRRYALALELFDPDKRMRDGE